MNAIPSPIPTIQEIYQSYVLYVFFVLILILFICYLLYTSRLLSQECSYMGSLYPSVNGYLASKLTSAMDASFTLCDYYVKTAYNA